MAPAIIRRRYLWTLLPTMLFCILTYRRCAEFDQEPTLEESIVEAVLTPDEQLVARTVHLAVTACNHRLEEAMVVIQSAAIFGKAHIHVHAFADSTVREAFSDSLEKLKRSVTHRPFSYTMYPTSFPSDHGDEWRQLFRPCSTQRLFFPTLLPSLDAIMHIDADSVFLRPPEDFWMVFDRFNSSHIAAMAPEGPGSTNAYIQRARHPYYHTHLAAGVAAGIVLMNLTRMREFRWSEHITSVFLNYRNKTEFGDQDLLNILFSFYPDRLHIFGCDWNYRVEHCVPIWDCEEADKNGVSLLHGSRLAFFRDDYVPVFKSVYDSFKRYVVGSDLKSNLLDPLHASLTSNKRTICGRKPEVFLKRIRSYVRQNQERSIS